MDGAKEIKKTNASKKGCLIVTVVSCLLLMSAILVSGIYFGMLTHNHFKSYWATYRLGNSLTVDEQITFTETEEDITLPGKARVIFDFENGLFIIRPSDKKVCYVNQFNRTSLMQPKQAKEHCEANEEHNHFKHTLKQIDETVTTEPEEIHARATDLEAELDILSPRAREMCFGCNIFWMKVEKDKDPTDEGREKREAQPIDVYIICIMKLESIKYDTDCLEFFISHVR